MTAKTIAIILAAGNGQRMLSKLPKVFLPLGKSTILELAVTPFFYHKAITRIIVCVPQGFIGQAQECLKDLCSPASAAVHKPVNIITGGDSRADSCYLALKSITDTPSDSKVLVHDAARPLIPPELLDQCLQALEHWDGVAPGVVATDTLGEVNAGQLLNVLTRPKIQQLQTPQGFHLKLLLQAHHQRLQEMDNNAHATSYSDDCGMVLGIKTLPRPRIAIIPSTHQNLKITSPQDLLTASQIVTGD